jgi:hypothetical protein
MTTTVATSSLASTGPRSSGPGVSWRRLMRVARIQHRAALITVLVALVVFGVAIVLGRDAVNAGYAKYLAAGCTLAHPTNPSVCPNTTNAFADIPSFTPLVIALRLFPLVIGAFVGAPLVAREVELGTYRFAWTQGVGRTRLLLVTLAMLALVVTPVAVILGLLLGGWYVHPYVVINPGVGNQWQPGLFTTTWWMMCVWTLFALALGTLVGTVVKRTVAAMAVTAIIVAASLLAIGQLLPRILAVGAVASSRVLLNGFPIGTLNIAAPRGFGPPGSWLVRGWFTGPSGHVLGARAADRVSNHAASLYLTKYGTNDPHAATRWLALHHYAYWISYQPAGHFWIIQATLGLVILALTALCGLGSIRVIKGRHA